MYLAREAEENRSLKIAEGIARDRRKFVFATQLLTPENPVQRKKRKKKKVGGRVYWRKLHATGDHRDQTVSSLLGK